MPKGKLTTCEIVVVRNRHQVFEEKNKQTCFRRSRIIHRGHRFPGGNLLFLSIIMEQSVSTEAVSFFCPVTGVAWRDILSTWINRIYFLWVNRRRLGDGTLSKPVANEGR